MRLHADFSKTAIVKPEDYQWVSSPRGEVSRVMFDRIGAENARATSLVSYAAGAIFPTHQHTLGEEILVLSGVFTEDDTRNYPEGWYLRNPHNSIHQASSKNGTLILVKLRQMTEQDLQQTRINTYDRRNWIEIGNKLICPLYQSSFETTYLEKINCYQNFINHSDQGIELFIISGQLSQENEVFPSGTWIRLPPKQHAYFQTSESGAILYLKTNHLTHAQNEWIGKLR